MRLHPVTRARRPQPRLTERIDAHTTYARGTCCWLLSRRSAISRTDPFEDDGVLVCIESLLKSLVLRESDPSTRPESEQLCTRAAMASDCAVGVQRCRRACGRFLVGRSMRTA